MAAVAGLYKRKLPSPPAIEFASPEGKRVFSEALQQGNMEGFFSLISYYQTQSEPAYCGLATLSVVLNALAIDPGRKWKGPWRWFDDSMLDCCEPLEKIKVKGITFDQVACLARCNGAKVEAFRTDQSTIEKFRNTVVSCTSLEGCHLIVSYHRGRLQQTGTGHFSPVGGYHAKMDLVLILDVARFKYPPHWVPLTLLWEAMNTIDEATGLHRGFMLLTKPQKAASILYTVSCHHESWRTTAKYLTKDIPYVLASEEINNIEELLGIIVSLAPADLKDFINWIVEVRLQEEGSKVGEEEKARLTVKEDILNQVRGAKLYEHVSLFLLSKSCCKLETGDSLTEIASEVCCQAAKIFCGGFGSSDATCCKETDTKLLKDNHEKTMLMVSGKVDAQSSERGIDILVPCWSMPNCSCTCVSSNSSRNHPSADDVLTILLLALPPTTWFGIRKEELKDEISGLLSTISLPALLQEEVQNLRQQLLCLSANICDP